MDHGMGIVSAVHLDGCVKHIGTSVSRDKRPRDEIIDRIGESFDQREPSRCATLAAVYDAGARLVEDVFHRTIRSRRYEGYILDRMGSSGLVLAHRGDDRKSLPRFQMEAWQMLQDTSFLINKGICAILNDLLWR